MVEEEPVVQTSLRQYKRMLRGMDDAILPADWRALKRRIFELAMEGSPTHARMLLEVAAGKLMPVLSGDDSKQLPEPTPAELEHVLKELGYVKKPQE